MPFTFDRNNTAGDDAADDVFTVQLASVPAGDIVVAVWVKHEGTPVNVSVSDGVDYINVLTGETAPAQITNHSNNDLSAGWFYRIIPSFAGGNIDVTVTLAAARAFQTVQAWSATYTDTASLDTHAENTGSGTSISSGNITTSGSNWVLAGYGEHVGNDSSAHQINGVDEDNLEQASGIVPNFTASWDRVVSTGFTGAATCANNSADWIANVIAFKTATGAPPPPGSQPKARRMTSWVEAA